MRLIKLVVIASGLALAVQSAWAQEAKVACGALLVMRGQHILLFKGDPAMGDPTSPECRSPAASVVITTRKVIPMELQAGDRIMVDYVGKAIDWEVAERPYMKDGDGALVRARLRRVGHPDATATLFADANESLSIYRSSEKE